MRWLGGLFSHRTHETPAIDALRAYSELSRIDDQGVSNPAPGLYEIVSGGKPLPSYTELRARYTDSTEVPEVDFRAALRNDSHAWDLRTRLEVVLGRPFLATQLVDQLTADTGARLADRLEAIVTANVEAAVRKVHEEVDRQVTDKINRLNEERAKVVSRERFGPAGRDR